MRCDSPIMIRDPVGRRNSILVPCGVCMACLSNKKSDWATRLEIEAKHSKSAWFLTLTYSDENLIYTDGRAVVWKKDLQNFMKRLRKKSGEKLKFYAVGEYGSNFERPHYHVLLFNLDLNYENTQDLILKAWNKGFIEVAIANEARVGYTLKYMLKKDLLKEENIEKEFTEFALMSKGLGLKYVETHGEYHKADISRSYVTVNGGLKRRLPRYLKEKIYSKAEIAVQGQMALKRVYNSPEDTEGFKNEIEQKVDRKRRVLQLLKNKQKI